MADFRKKKLMYVFNVFFDVNKSGTIERKDFELAIETICRSRGWGESDPKYAETHSTLIKVWETLRQRADTDQDLQVNQDEWIKMWDDYKKSPDTPLEWQKLYMNFMFDHIDSSGDGTIDLAEFTTVFTGYGLSTEECEKAFDKFTKNKTVEINREAFGKLWNEFFSSEDPQAPGNFIFGKCSFE
ncbi:calexcitin-2 [Anabrus simplex]|uniref:calexcitin-2 n=1 Tax=Anabrus simplex TaxID=316456 RepID=UPI0034DD76BB